MGSLLLEDGFCWVDDTFRKVGDEFGLRWQETRAYILQFTV